MSWNIGGIKREVNEETVGGTIPESGKTMEIFH
jgi:hypothetical protein